MVFTYVLTYFLVTLVGAGIGFAFLIQLAPDMGPEREIRAFRSYLIGILWFMLTNSVWIWINYDYLNISGWPFSMANLIGVCVASYYWFKYIELRINSALVDTTAFWVIALIPLWIASILVVTTPFTHLVFYYTETNEYIHGPLYSTMAILAILYLLVATAHMFLHVRNVHTPSERAQFNTLMFFLIFPVLGGIIDIIVPNLPVMELMLILSTVIIYTNMQQSRINIDVLTGLNNRRLTDDYLTEQIATASSNNPLFFFIGDIDNFKTINDSYGHSEGDRALKLIARGLIEGTKGIPCYHARWGGDEFVTIVRGKDATDPNKFANRVMKAIDDLASKEKTPYRVEMSYGFAKVVSSDAKPQDVLREADEKMYAMKRRHKVWRTSDSTTA